MSCEHRQTLGPGVAGVTDWQMSYTSPPMLAGDLLHRYSSRAGQSGSSQAEKRKKKIKGRKKERQGQDKV